MQIIDRRLLTQIDWLLIATTALLALAGLVTIYSATFAGSQYIYTRHTFFLALGTLIFLVTVILDYSLLDRFAYQIYAFAILALFIVLFLDPIAGTHRWISLGFISFQPSEFSKLALVVALAKYFSARTIPEKGLDIKGLLRPSAILAVPFLLVAREPDLGTALTLLLIFCTMALVVKVNWKTLVGITLALAPVVPLAWSGLKEYQKTRVLSFFSPSEDTLGSGYHLLQSKIAIGSGGLLGKGFTKGTQGTLRFLPEHHTDFVFPIFAEEWGFISCFILLSLFMLLILRGLNTAKTSKDRFGFLAALGISAIFFWHVVINLGMVCGLLPVVGMPLPFLSYGGSFLVTSLVGVGILVNIGMRRFIF